MSDPFAWPALRGAEPRLGEVLRAQVGIWGKVQGQASDYRWIARTPGFVPDPDLERHLRIGAEDQPARAWAWRAPWTADSRDYFAVGLYPSRARDAAGRAAVLEKQVLRWRRPAGVPAVLGALALLPMAGQGGDDGWWGRLGAGDWARPDFSLSLGPAAEVAVTPGRDGLVAVLAEGLAGLTAALDEPRLAALYAALLAGQRPVLGPGLAGPLAAPAVAALLLPLEPGEAGRLSLCGWVPAALVDALDLGGNWDLALSGQPAREPVSAPRPSPVVQWRAERLAAALHADDPQRLVAGVPESAYGNLAGPVSPHAALHPSPRMGLDPPDRPGLDALFRFADTVNLRRLDLGALALDLAAEDAESALAVVTDPERHPLIGWIRTLTAHRPAGVEAADWGFKIDQLRAAAMVVLPHPRTLALVGLPADPRVPALLAVLALPPGQAAVRLAGHGAAALERLWSQTLACPQGGLAAEIQAHGQKKSPAGSRA